jgi:hypothetical protein
MVSLEDPSKSDGETKNAKKSSVEAGNFFSRFIGRTTESLSSVGFGVRLILLCAFALIAALILFWILDKLFLFYAAKSYVDELADAFALNKHLTRALLISSFMAALIFGRQIWSISSRRRLIGIIGISVLLVGHSLALWYGTRDNYFDRTGAAAKCYVLTRDGKVTYGEVAGIDPATGRLCRPVTAEMLERLQQYEQGKRPTLITDLEPNFFEARTGEPVVWYYQSPVDGIQLFDLMGFHPQTGEELVPITKQVVDQWKKQTAVVKRDIPKPVNPSEFIFFDPRDGSPRAWYWRGPDGKYEFFDHAGFHPRTGEALNVVTREELDSWKKTLARATPKRVDPNSYAFFDPATGAARVWYWRSDDGSYEFYDASGFHPRTGDKLELVTRDIASKWKKESEPKKTETPLATPRPDPTALLEAKARSFLYAYMDISGAENSIALAYVVHAFAPTVNYFGKRLSNREVIEDKRSFMARWPERSYRLKAETIRISCNAVEISCDVGAEFNFRAFSPIKGVTSSGIATNQIRLLLSGSEPQIESENGTVISRVSEDSRIDPQPGMYAGPGAPQPQQNMSPQQQQMLNGFFGIVRQFGR